MSNNFEIYNNTLTNESLAEYAKRPTFNANEIYNVPVSENLEIEATDGDVLTYDALTGEIHFEPTSVNPNPVYNADKIYNVNVSPDLVTEAKDNYVLTYDSVDSNIKFEPTYVYPTPEYNANKLYDVDISPDLLTEAKDNYVLTYDSIDSNIKFEPVPSTFDTITTDAFQLAPPQLGNILQCDDTGFMQYIPQYTDRCITLKPDANDALPLESSTLYGAVQKAQALVPTATDAVWINIMNGEYHETQATVVDSTMFLLTVTGPLQYWGAQFFLDTNLGVSSTWITLECPGGEWSDMLFDAQLNADHVFRVDGAVGGGAAVDLTRVMARNGRVSQFYIDNGALIYNIFGVPWPAVTSDYGVLVDNGSEYISDICTVYVGDSDAASDCIYHYIDNASVMTMLNDSQYGSSYTVYGGGPSNSRLVEVHNGSSVALSGGRLFDFDTCFQLFTGSSMITRNINFETSNVAINNAYDSTCTWNSLADLYLTSQIVTTGLNSNNCALLYKDTSLNDNPSIKCVGDFNVGLRGFDSRSYFGEGGSDVSEAHVLLSTNATTFTDVTQDLLESNSVPTTLFQNLTTGYVYVGDNERFATVQFNITSAQIKGTAVFVTEYWNGVSWVSLNYMVTNSAPPYNSYNINLFTDVTLQSIRLDIILQRSTIWQSNLVVNGIADHYWIRIRQTSGNLTQSAIANYFKIFGSTTSITRYGNVLCHGLARTLKNIPYDLNSTNGLVSAGLYTDPSSQDVYFSQNLALGRQINLFDSNNDANSLCFLAPSDLDSSCLLSLRIVFASSSNAAAQLGNQFTIRIAPLDSSNVSFATVAGTPATVTNEQLITDTFTPNQTNGAQLVFKNINFYVPTIESSSSTGDTTQIIVVTIKRTVSGTANTVFVQLGLYYYSWRLTDIFVP